MLTPEEQQTLKLLLQKARSSGKADNRFDLNLAEGKQAESDLLALLGDNTIEVKRDFAASTTGNFAVEFMCRNKPSGISTTKADWWAFVPSGDFYNDEIVVLIKTKRLERLLVSKRIVRGGDNKCAELYLLRVEELLKPLPGTS